MIIIESLVIRYRIVPLWSVQFFSTKFVCYWFVARIAILYRILFDSCTYNEHVELKFRNEWQDDLENDYSI